MPSQKRRRGRQNEEEKDIVFTDNAGELGSAGETMKTKSKETRRGGARKQRGRLQSMLKMPLDVILEV
jgi:hypothetical protein